ncbi:MAG: HAMP domain-containing histidine kinase [Candidatus Obscuribacterales bacterium]|nr:HAMP domain-containing histidine kinase [Candidatus Obscuribacterales bacterium]
MIQSLRLKLTFLFVVLFLLIYGMGGSAALLVFYSGLSKALDEEIEDLLFEILPAVEFQQKGPSLTNWALAAKEEHLTIPAGIQIFDKNGKLVESYGLTGNTSLREGEFSVISKGEKDSRRSNFEELRTENKLVGYLQIQMSTNARDNAVRQFGFTMLWIFPFLSITVALAGYFFAGLALKPVEDSILVLKTFVADAGHEFITPVTVVEASLQTLEEILKENGISLDILSIISRASNRMKELASDLIFLAKIDNPISDLPKELMSIGEIIDPAYEEVMELAKSKGIELSRSRVPEAGIRGNRHALKIMISNLLSNAIKYTDAGGKVTLSASLEGNKVAITIEDNGIGIAPEKIDRIFDRFYRVDQSRSRESGGSGGSGLGLAIVKATLELHRAEIDVQSSPGKGSKFTVRLPKVG